MYFWFFKLKKWGKKTAETRRRNCVVLPLLFYDHPAYPVSVYLRKPGVSASDLPEYLRELYQV